MTTVVLVARLGLAALMIIAGIAHFRSPAPFVGIVPAWLPAPLAIVYVSGVVEVLLGAGLLIPATTRPAAWALIAFFVAVFPANLNMAMNNLPFGSAPVAPWAAWARLPLQGVLIAWAWWIAAA